VKIGVLTDLSGPSADLSGQGSIIDTQLAIDEFNDIAFGEGSVREDGRQLHDMYLFEMKKPEDSKGA
jgi:branched-chain amino acid transport system substrate-binding protein